MKRLSLLLALSFATSLCCATTAPINMELIGSRVALKKTAAGSIDVQAGKLLYRDHNGESDETGETYLVLFVNDVPSIVDRIQGFGLKCEVVDINEDGNKELLCFFHAGANQLQLRMYKITSGETVGEGIIPLSPTLSSNMAYIKIAQKTIEVRNDEPREGSDKSVVTTRFRVAQKSSILVSEATRQP